MGSATEYRGAQTCARCGIGLDPDDTHITSTGAAVCRSCNAKHQLAQLPRATMSSTDGSLLLGLRHVLGRVTRGRVRSTACVLAVAVPAFAVAEGDWPARMMGIAWLTALAAVLFVAARKYRHVVD